MKQISKIIILNCWKRKNEGLAVQKIISAILKEMNSDIEVEISYDDGSLNIWGNYKQALKIPSENERFRFIIQDDMLVSRQAIEKMIYILTYFPDDCFVSFYVPKNKGYKECSSKGHRVLKTYTNFWTQAFCFPSSKINELIEWGDKLFLDKDPNLERWEDTRVENYCVNNKIPIYAVLPSLFQHLGAYRSALGISGEIGKNKRYSDQFQPDKDVFQVDWKKEIENPYVTEKPRPKDYHKYTI